MHRILLVAVIGFAVQTGPAVAQSPSPAGSPSAAAEAEPASKLGLGERRGIKKYQDEKFPEIVKSIRKAAGFDVEIDFRWDTIALPGQGESYSEDGFWTKIYSEPLIAALQQIGKDDLGKQALKRGLKKVVVLFDEKTAPASNYPNGLTFEAGTLSINWTPNTNVDDVKERVKAIVSTLEPKL